MTAFHLLSEPFYQERWKLILSIMYDGDQVDAILSREVEANSQHLAHNRGDEIHFIKRGGS